MRATDKNDKAITENCELFSKYKWRQDDITAGY